MYCWAHNVPLSSQGKGILHQNAYQIESELENTWAVQAQFESNSICCYCTYSFQKKAKLILLSADYSDKVNI